MCLSPRGATRSRAPAACSRRARRAVGRRARRQRVRAESPDDAPARPARPAAQTLAVRLAAEANAARVDDGGSVRCADVSLLGLDTEHVFCHHGEHMFASSISSVGSSSSRSASLLWALFAGETGAGGPERQLPCASRATRSGRSPCATFPGDPREGVWELQERNGLASATIVPGQVLVLPGIARALGAAGDSARGI